MLKARSNSFVVRAMASIQGRVFQYLEKIKVSLKTRHLYGPRRVVLNDDECAMVSMIKDADYFVDELIKHHTNLGVKHILLIDNGSIDETILRASKYANVTIVQNDLPPGKYETLLRGEIPKSYIVGGWILFADSDELITLPSEHYGRLGTMLGYCNLEGYTAVVGQMLDMFSSLPLSATRAMNYSRSMEKFNFYSTESIVRFPFHSKEIPFIWHLSHNKNVNPDIKVMYGGIRRAQFGEMCCLTKQPLVRNLPGIVLSAHPHCARYVTYADFSILIRHYKFCGDIQQREKKQVLEKVWSHGQDQLRVKALSENSELVINCEGKKQFNEIDSLIVDLIDDGFLVLSDKMDMYKISERVKNE